MRKKIKIDDFVFVLTMSENCNNMVVESSFSIHGQRGKLSDVDLQRGEIIQSRFEIGEYEFLILLAGGEVIELPAHDIIIGLSYIEYNTETEETRWGGGRIIHEEVKEVCEHCKSSLCDFDCPESFKWANIKDAMSCEDKREELEGNRNFNHAADGMLSMLLAHAVAGIDVRSPAYIEGLETAIDAIGNNI